MSNGSDPTSLGCIGRNVSAVRRYRGLSQEKLAAQAGCSRSQLARLECGRSRRPSYQIIACIAGALGVTPQQLEEPGFDRKWL